MKHPLRGLLNSEQGNPATTYTKLLPIYFIAAAIPVLVLLWVATEAVLSSDRGLDVTDEGLYLLSADPPNASASWFIPFGWSTAPLFAMVGYDIASFRTLGAVLLLVAGGWLGWASTSLVAYVSRGELLGRQYGALMTTFGTVLGASGAWFYYTNVVPFLRTPSYNWANLFGIMIAVAATLTLVQVLNRFPQPRYRVVSGTLAVIAALGLFITLPAKPSTAPIAIIAMGGLLVCWLGFKRGFIWTVSIFAGIWGWLLFAVATTWWPIDFAAVFARGLQMPPPLPSQTVPGAIRDAVTIPTAVWSDLMGGHRPMLVVLLVGLSFQLIPVIRRRRQVPIRIAGFLIALVASWTLGDVTRYFAITISVVLLFAQDPHPNMLPRPMRNADFRSWFIVIVLLFLPFIYAFGSGNGIYLQAGMAVGTLLLASLTIVIALARDRLAYVALTFISIFAITSLVSSTSNAREHPYRILPIASQTQAISIASTGSTLLVDRDLFGVLNSLERQASAAGWKVGTPLVGIVWAWSSTVPYFLGARPPESLMLTLFGYEDSEGMAAYNLGPRYQGFPWDEAWVLSSPPTGLEAASQEQVNAVSERLEVRTGRDFPGDYYCVGHAAGLELWKPRSGRQHWFTKEIEGDGECRPATPATSRYNFFLGTKR